MLKKYLLPGLLALSLAAPVFATESSEASLAELLAVSGAEKQYTQMCDVLAQSVQAGFNLALSQSLGDKVPDEEAVGVIRAQAKALSERYRKQLAETMPWQSLVKEVYSPLYRKHFSQEEVDQLIAFYKSDAGKKFSEKAPALIQDAAIEVNLRYMPALVSLSSGLIQDTLTTVLKETGIPQVKCGDPGSGLPKCEDMPVPPQPATLKE